MKKLAILVFMAAVFGFVGVSIAQKPHPRFDPNRPKFDPNTIRGRVIVEKDADGNITAAQLESRRHGTCNIVLDEKGKELAEKMADKFVAVTGKTEIKDDQKWLTVEKYSEMQGPQGRRGPDDPNRPRRPRGPRGPGGPDEGGE
ncbi:MAG: hypothetical protein CVV39_08930 [Planctomycetes bacterium HGW-Planctomycetes-1]|nr:MAG: hypothetical protein CVV39_08930 [Planctomycetes bacterium HGW-Planctomycetes-1]